MSDEELAVQEEQDGTGDENLSDDEKKMAALKEAISVEREDLGGLRMKLTVTVPRETIDERMGDQFAELKRDAQVPGFRKGHAPMKLIEKRFGSDVGDELKGKLLGSGYMAAIEKEDLKPLGDPQIWINTTEERIGDDEVAKQVDVDKLVGFETALEHVQLPKDGAFTFACELELKPEFELPKLEKIPLEKPAVSISEDDVEAELKKMRMMRGAFEPVEKGKIVADDMLYAAMKMTVDGDTIAQDDNFDMAARDINVKGVRLEGFGDAVVGKKINDEFVFEATVPDDHEDADLRGKTAKFDLKILEIKRLKLPDIDEAFLSSVGMESEKELREAMKSGLEAEVDRVVARKMHDQIGDYLIDNTKIEIPAGLSQRQTERSVSRRMMEMLQSGMPASEVTKAVDEMRASAAEQVVRDLKLFFVLEKIADDREVDVNEEEMNGAIAQIAARAGKRFDRVRDELSQGDGLNTLYMRIRDEKVLTKLVEDAEVTEATPEKKKTSGKTAKKTGGAAKKKVTKTAEKKTAKAPAAKKKKKAAKKST